MRRALPADAVEEYWRRLDAAVAAGEDPETAHRRIVREIVDARTGQGSLFG